MTQAGSNLLARAILPQIEQGFSRQCFTGGFMPYAAKIFILLSLCFGLLAVPAHAGESSASKGKTTSEKSETQFAVGQKFTGTSAWYGIRAHGKRTASGTTFDCTQLTAAHRTLPFGTLVKVTNKKTKKSVVVQITDRGPAPGYLIDISRQAAMDIGMREQGSATVTLEIVALPASYAYNSARKQ